MGLRTRGGGSHEENQDTDETRTQHAMGQAKSKAFTSVINEVRTELETSIRQSCSNTVSAQNFLQLVADGDIELEGITQKNVVVVDTECALKSLQNADLVNDLMSQITQKISQKDDRMFKMFENNENNVRSETHNLVQQFLSVSVEQISEASTLAKNTINLRAGGSIRSGQPIVQDNAVESSFRNAAEQVSETDLAQNLGAKIDAAAEQEQTFTKTFTEGFTNILSEGLGGKAKGYAVLVIALAVLGAVLLFGYIQFKKAPADIGRKAILG